MTQYGVGNGKSYLIRIMILFVLLSSQVLSQWSRDSKVNTPLSTANNDQTLPKVVTDGASGAIVVWQDKRDSSTRGIDLYAQRISSRGITQWTPNGVVVTRALKNQLAAVAVSDGRGGVIVVWEDTRGSNTDIYAQHISSDSTKLWTSDGIPVCTATNEQTTPVVETDNLGGAIIVWQDYRNGNADLYAQHIESGGNLTWSANGVPVSTAGNDQIQASIVSDNANGAVVVWQDLRNNTDYNIYAQRIRSDSVMLWTVDGVPISTSSNHQRFPALAPDGSGGAFIAWEDYRLGFPNIYLQRVNSLGTPQLLANGLRIVSIDANQTLPRIISDGIGGAIISWHDLRDGNQNIYTQRSDGSGSFQWGVDALPVCTAVGTQSNLVMTTDGSSGAILAWEDARPANGLVDIYAQRVLAGGSTLWTLNGVGICTDTLAQANPAIIDNGVHGAIFAWQDNRKFATQRADIYSQLINPDGSLGGFSIHGRVFNDLDRNGVQDTLLEPALSGWIINITGAQAKSDTTDVHGEYSFDGLTPGIYIVKQIVKAGWMQTSTQDSVVNLSIGGDSLRNFGDFELGTISGKVFKDRNHNGIQDGGEGIDSARVIRLTGTATAQTTTNVNGNFTFVGLPVGTFYVKEDPRTGWIQSSLPDSFAITLNTLGQDTTGIAFGSFQLGRVNGKVSNDLLGDSSITGDAAIAGWNLKLIKNGAQIAETFTDGTGLYFFSNLDTGQYVVRESLNVGWIQTFPKLPGDTILFGNQRAYKIRIDTTNTILSSKDFGNFKLGKIIGSKFEDVRNDSSVVGDPTLSGWRIKLFKGGSPIDSSFTSGSGSFTFSNLVAGMYTVEESLPGGWRQTFPRVDTSLSLLLYGDHHGPRAPKVFITSGKTATINFGNFHFGAVQGHVYLDVARDSLVLGDPPISGYRVRISNRVIIHDTTYGEFFLRDTTTDLNGVYVLDNLDFGRYRVAESLMVSSIQTYPRTTMPGVAAKAGSRQYDIFVDSSGEINSERDFGNYTGYITGTVYNDINGDGIQEFADSGLPNVVIKLSGTKTDSAITDANGNYSFVNLDVGAYVVTLKSPLGWIRTAPESKNSYNVSITAGSKFVPGLDYGIFRMGAIGGRVFYDLDSNRHREPSEPGIFGWRVYLKGDRIDSTLTDINGDYSFLGLPLGVYIVKEAKVPGWIQTVPADSQLVILASGESALHVDFGNTGLSRITGTVFNDLDRKGSKEPAEPGIAGWKLFLRGGFRSDTAVTDANGFYVFSRLSPSEYTITQSVQQGWIKTFPKTTVEWLVPIAAAQNAPGKDFGNFKLGILSGIVFNDHNGDGLRDPQDSGLANFKVFLTTGATTDSVLSDANGMYSFADLDTGKYIVQQQPQPYWIQTLPLTTAFYRDTITISGQVKTSRDFGNLLACIITGVVFDDQNADGNQDPGDVPLANRKLTLERFDGNIVGDTVALSADNGVYQFTGLSPGMYMITQEILSGWFQTSPDAPEMILIESNGQVIEGKNFGNFYFSMSGVVFDDYNGNGSRDPGEPGRGGIRLYLSKDSQLADSTLTNGSGEYTFGSRGPGMYTIFQNSEIGWIQTSSVAPITVNHSSGINLTGQNIGNFHKVSVSGTVFEDNNRSGARDAGEPGIVQTIIALYRNGSLFEKDTTLSDGSYQIDNLTPGSYALYQQTKAGYVKSFPVSPDSYKFVPQSGNSLSGKNFGIFLMLSSSITARSFRDNDGQLTTSDDRLAQSWTLNLYRAGSLLKSTNATSLDTSNLPDGTYIVEQADSSGSGWLSVGKIRTTHFTSGPDSVTSFLGTILSDTIVLQAGQSRIVDFMNAKLGQVVLRAFADTDTKFSTSGDRTPQKRTLELYTGFVALGNFIQSIHIDSALTVNGQGSGRYVARQVDSAGWRTIGRRFNNSNRSGSADTVIFDLPVGGVDTVDFVNAGEGTIVIHKFFDADGDTGTTNDRELYSWNLQLLKDSSATPPKIDTVYAESLSTNLLAGNYIAKEITNPQWRIIGTYRDNVFIGEKDTAKVSLGSGERHVVDFINTTTSKTRTWFANADAQWSNHLNWSPPVVPTDGDSVIIRPDHPWRIPIIPGHTFWSSLTVNPSAALHFSEQDTVTINGNLQNEGLLIVGANDTPVVVLNGSYKGGGTFTPGHSTVLITSGTQRTIAGGEFYNLEIGTPASMASTPTTTQTTDGNLYIDGILTLNDDLNATNDTIFITNDDTAALRGSGNVIGGTIVRTLRSFSGLLYRYHYDSTYVRFTNGVGIPSSALLTMYPNTSSSDFGTSWDSVSAAIDTVHNLIRATGIQAFSVLRPWAFGVKLGNDWTPLLRRVYVIATQPDTGFSADITLRYEPQDLPPSFNEASLVLLRQRLVYVAISDTFPSGWMLVSLPVGVSDARFSTIFSGDISGGFRFDVGGSYLPETLMVNGIGYWANFPVGKSYEFSGLERTRDSINTPSGWSLFGTLSSPLDVRSVRTAPSDNLESNFFGFNGAYSVVDTLEPGRAYWVKQQSAGKLILDTRIPPVAKQTAFGLPANANTLFIRDASGRQQTLYFGAGENNRTYELPPAPPEGIFDVRFANNSWAQMYAENMDKETSFRILLNSVTYPVEVRWKVREQHGKPIALAQVHDQEIDRMTLNSSGSLRIEDSNVKALQLFVGGKKQIPETFALYQCYPNPFNPTTRIDFDLPEQSVVTLKVYDILGREVVTLLNGETYGEGRQSYVFNASGYASGVYFYRITASSQNVKFQSFKKMLLLK